MKILLKNQNKDYQLFFYRNILLGFSYNQPVYRYLFFQHLLIKTYNYPKTLEYVLY